MFPYSSKNGHIRYSWKAKKNGKGLYNIWHRGKERPELKSWL